ncbi:MAG: phosphoribosylglycinamide formyltransferase [Bacteroidales bacterium]
MNSCPLNIAIFASGSGTNAENLIRYFSRSKYGKIVLLLSNKKDALVLEKAYKLAIPTKTFTYSEFCGKEINPNKFITIMKNYNIDLILLAGFLLKVPKYLLSIYPKKIINIHPALLPAYGGKGMHGIHVHQTIIAAGEKKSGITIHLIDENYDKGKIIFQGFCNIESGDNAEDLAAKIHVLEQANFPKVIEKYIIEHPTLFIK